jgi:tRNA pseudouridine38-40 synthase
MHEADRTAQGQRFRASVRYDGTDFAGWQVQPNARTVQAAVEEALASIAQEPVRVHAAGRTDAGVHALGQVMHFDWPVGRPHDRLALALSRMLAPSVQVSNLLAVPPSFHARYSATGKHYAYTLHLAPAPDPFTARHAWQVRAAVDMERLAEWAQAVAGTHDFAGYQCAGTDIEDTRRTIHSVRVEPGPLIGPADATNHWRIHFQGNGFLYKMVRNLVGTLVDAARGKLPPTILTDRLASPGPYDGYTAPAHGLALVSVAYADAAPD